MRHVSAFATTRMTDGRVAAAVDGADRVAPAVDRHRVERHGDRRPRAAPSRRGVAEPEEHGAVRRLPGRRHARTAAGRRRDSRSSCSAAIVPGGARASNASTRCRRTPTPARSCAGCRASRVRRRMTYLVHGEPVGAGRARRAHHRRAAMAGAHRRAPRARRARLTVETDADAEAIGGAMNETTAPAPATTAAPADRQYLLERVDEAAVVQLYADGFRDLPLREKTLIWHLYQAAIAGRDIYYDQRYAHNLEMRDVLEAIVTHADRRRSDDARRDPALHEAVLDQHRPVQQPDRAQVRARRARPTAFAAAAHAAAQRRRALSAATTARRSTRCSRASQPMFFDPDVDPIVTSKTPRAGKDILTASANNLYVGVTMTDLEGFEEQHPLNSRLVKQRRPARRRGLPRRRPLRRADRRDRRAPRGRDPVRDRADGEGAARADHVLPAPARTPTARRTTSPGCRTRRRRSTRSTASSRSTSTRAASRARGKRSSSTSTGRRRRQIQTLAAQRAVVRGPHAVGPEVPQGKACRASPPTPSTSSSRPATPGRSRRSASTCRTIRRSASSYGSKSVSLSNVNEAYDKSTLPEFRSEFSWTPEEAARAEQVERVRRRADDEHARGDRPRVGQGRRAAERQPAGGAEGAVLGARGGARRSRRALLPARSASWSSSAWCRPTTRTRSSAPSTRATRATRWCSCAASARARRSKKTTCATAR